ncbi:NeuD/PglB/VioB family sugar acetyltransferase [Gimesia aquarii]|uniref:Acetyltransferase EpsM n=1 Tax=Gimesia aquarii TaxID=2527964 RepID=A0A517VZR0_9PLAN|nr:NeuD/PglB/VioB family sugar acetyltransferase [Gimesia aquarii]QDT98488.1 Putative acetyltransferase EpsM [Gimesia aquarii]
MNETSNAIILLGGGGHAKVLIDLITERGEYKIVGILDPKMERGTHLKGIDVLGADDALSELRDQGIKNVAIAVGSTKCNLLRKTLFDRSRELDFQIPALIHPNSICSSDISLSDGVQIMAGAIIQTDSILGEGTVVNTGAQVDHDCQIGSHVFLSPGVVLSGGVVVGNNAFVGAGAIVIQGVKVGDNAIIAAGAVVIQDVKDGALVKGVPAR